MVTEVAFLSTKPTHRRAERLVFLCVVELRSLLRPLRANCTQREVGAYNKQLCCFTS